METHKAALAHYQAAPIHRTYRAVVTQRVNPDALDPEQSARARFETTCPYCGRDTGTLLGAFEVSSREHVRDVPLSRSGYVVPGVQGRTTDLQLVTCPSCGASITPLAYLAPTAFLAQRDGAALAPPTRSLALVGPTASVGLADADDPGDDARDPEPSPPADAMALQITYVRWDTIHVDEMLLPVRRDTELRESIQQQGVLEPVTLCEHPEIPGHHTLLVGGRRFAGAEGVQELVPAIVRRDLRDITAQMLFQLASNQMKPVSPIDEARAYAKIRHVTGISIRRLAHEAQVPKSTVSERLHLLELGPWVALIEDGTISVGIATERLLSLRGAPPAVHQQALDRMRKSPAWIQSGGAMSGPAFGRLVVQHYAPFVYPLVATDAGPQPEFDTSDHHGACPCGGIDWPDDSWNGTRLSCVNPAYWGPRRDAARRAAVTAAASSAAGERGTASTTPAAPDHAHETPTVAAEATASNAESAGSEPLGTAPARLDADDDTMAGLLYLAVLAAGSTVLEEARALGIGLEPGTVGRARVAPERIYEALMGAGAPDRLKVLSAVARRARERRLRQSTGARPQTSGLRLAS